MMKWIGEWGVCESASEGFRGYSTFYTLVLLLLFALSCSILWFSVQLITSKCVFCVYVLPVAFKKQTMMIISIISTSCYRKHFKTPQGQDKRSWMASSRAIISTRQKPWTRKTYILLLTRFQGLIERLQLVFQLVYASQQQALVEAALPHQFFQRMPVFAPYVFFLGKLFLEGLQVGVALAGPLQVGRGGPYHNDDECNDRPKCQHSEDKVAHRVWRFRGSHSR